MADSVMTILDNELEEEPGNVSGNTNVDILTKKYHFGCGPCHPNCLQVLFARKKFFTLLLSLNVLLQSTLVSGMISSVLSTVEKRYNFSSTAAGLMVISYDVTILVSVLFVSHFGNKVHQPRLLGICVFLMGLGALLFSSPQFLFGPYRPAFSNFSSSPQQLCFDQSDTTNITNVTTITTASDDCSSANNIAYVMFIISNVIIGLSTTPLYTVGYAYIDEIVYPKYISLHIGVVGVMLVIGPLIGYGFGSVFLSIYVDPWSSTSLIQNNPLWVGAWWIPFIIIAIALFVLAIPFLMFPRYLPDSYLVRQERAKEMAKIYPSKYANESTISLTFKMFPVHIKRLLLNFQLMFAVLAFSGFSLFLQGIISFIPKFFEVQYRFSAFVSGLVVAAIGIPGGVIGTLVGTFIVFGCKLRGKNNALVGVVCMLIVLPLILGFLIHCPAVPIAGVTSPYRDGSGTCSSLCNCSFSNFEPVCGDENLTYFSPCQAGCLRSTQDKFANCSCVMNSHGTVTEGFCNSQCTVFILALLLLALIVLVSFIVQLPYIQFLIRAVSDDQRSLALGIQSVCSRLLGSIPGPLLVGALFDVSCVSWQEECNRRGNCWIYDNSKLSYNIISLGLPATSVAVIFLLLAWLTYPKNKIVDSKGKTETKHMTSN